jgi:hypothetical protein
MGTFIAAATGLSLVAFTVLTVELVGSSRRAGTAEEAIGP